MYICRHWPTARSGRVCWMGTMVEGLIVDPPGKRETSTSTTTCTCINALKFAHRYFEYRGQENLPTYLQGQLYAQIAEIIPKISTRRWSKNASMMSRKLSGTPSLSLCPCSSRLVWDRLDSKLQNLIEPLKETVRRGYVSTGKRAVLRFLNCSLRSRVQSSRSQC